MNFFRRIFKRPPPEPCTCAAYAESCATDPCLAPKCVERRREQFKNPTPLQKAQIESVMARLRPEDQRKLRKALGG